MRRTSAMSRSRIRRPLDRKLTSSRSFSDLNAPVTRIDSFSSPVWIEPAGITAFCACSAAISAARSMPDARQLAGREFDIDLLVLRAEDLDLGDVGNLQQLRAHVLDIIAQFAMAEAVVGGKGVDQAKGVAEIVVEAGADHALRQGPANVAELFLRT